MERKILFLKVNGPQKCCGAEVIPFLAASAVSSIAGSVMASQTNAEMMQTNKDMQADAQKWNEKMYVQQMQDQEDMYNKYQSPQAIAKQLREAGLNPSALASGGLSGGSMPSVPSVGSSPALSSPSLSNPAAPLQQGINDMASSISQLSSAENQTAEAEKTRSMLAGQLESLMLQNKQMDLHNHWQEFQNYLQQNFGEDKMTSEISDNLSRAYLNYMTGDTQKALSGYYDVLTKIGDNEYKISYEKAANIGTYIQLMLGDMQAGINLKNQSIKTGKSQESLNYSLGSYYKSLTETENALRSGRIEMQDLANDLATIDKFSKGLDYKMHEESYDARKFSLIEQCYQQGLISENLYKEGQILSTRLDWAGRQEFANYCKSMIGCMSDVVNSYANIKGVQLNRLSAKERNEIRDRFTKEYEARGQYQRSYAPSEQKNFGSFWQDYVPAGY